MVEPRFFKKAEAAPEDIRAASAFLSL